MGASNSRTISLKFTGDIADLVAAAGGADAAIRGVGDAANKTSEGTSKSLGLLPLAAGAAGAAVGAALIAGAAVGVVGLGALVLKSNQEVENSARDLGLSVADEAKSSAAQLQGPMVAALNQIKGTISAAKPELDQLFAGVKPDIPIITTGIDNMVKNLLPGLVNVTRNGVPVVQAMSDELGQLGKDGANTLTSLSLHASDYGVVLHSVGNLGTVALGTLTNLMNDAAQVWAKDAPAIDALVRTLGSDLSAIGSDAAPAVASGLNSIAQTANIALHALQPFEPLLGAIGGEFATVFLAQRSFGLLGTAVSSVGSTVGDLSGKARSMTVNLTGSAAAGAAVGTAMERAGGAITTAGKAIPILGVGVTLLDQAWHGLVGTTSDYVNQVEQGTVLSAKQSGQLAINSETVNQLSFGNKTLNSALSSLIPTTETVNKGISDWYNSLSLAQRYQTDATTEQKAYNEAVTKYGQDSPQANDALSTWQGTLQAATNATDNQTAAINKLKTGSSDSASDVNTLAGYVKTLGSDSSSASDKVTALQNAVKLLGENGNETANDALSNLWQQVNNLGSSLKGQTGALFDANGQLNVYTDKGEAARTTMESAATQLAAYNQAIVQQGGSQQYANQATQDQIDKMAGPLATQLGITTGQAKDLITEYYKTPPSINTNFGTSGIPQATQQTNDYINDLGKIPKSIVTDIIAKVASGSGGDVYTPFSLPGGPGKAAGGPVIAGRSYVVGEKGYEVFTPNVSGTITPHDESAAALNGAGGGDGVMVTGDLVFPIDLGNGVQQVIRITNRQLKQRVKAGAQ